VVLLHTGCISVPVASFDFLDSFLSTIVLDAAAPSFCVSRSRLDSDAFGFLAGQDNAFSEDIKFASHH